MALIGGKGQVDDRRVISGIRRNSLLRGRCRFSWPAGSDEQKKQKEKGNSGFHGQIVAKSGRLRWKTTYIASLLLLKSACKKQLSRKVWLTQKGNKVTQTSLSAATGKLVVNNLIG